MRRIAVAAAVLVLAGGVAQAEPVLFDDRAAFDAAVGSHSLFTDFPLTYVPSTFDYVGDFGGVTIRNEIFELVWQPTEAGDDTLGFNGTHTEGRGAGLFSPTSVPLAAIGFDLLEAWTFLTPPNEPSTRVSTDVFVRFATAAGFGPAVQIQGGFFGALLYDDVFTAMHIFTAPPTCVCQSGFIIDNLATRRDPIAQQPIPQSVPESSTSLLLGLGLLAVAIGARKL